MLRSCLVALSLLAICFFYATPLFAQASIEPLAIAAGSSYSRGLAVSADSGTVVGHSGEVGDTVAYRWQAGSSVPLAFLPGFADLSEAAGVSGNGSVVVGDSKSGSRSRAVRWVGGGVEQLPVLGTGFQGDSHGYGVSADGVVTVGSARAPSLLMQASLWDANGLRMLGTLDNVAELSEARACSSDGRVVVGRSGNAGNFDRAFRWENGVMEDLGAIGTPTGHTVAYDVSADGEIVVGSCANGLGKAFRWTREDDMQALLPIDRTDSQCAAYGVSDDGRTVVGMSHGGHDTGGDACIWRDGDPRQLWYVLKDDYGLDPAADGWGSLVTLAGCSADGAVLTGYGMRRTAADQPYVGTPFRITIPRLNNVPSIEGSVADGATVVVRDGAVVTVEVEAWDKDAGDDLTLEAVGLPTGATLTPPVGTKKIGTEQAPFVATFVWTPGSADVGVPRDVTIAFRDEMNGVASLTFTVEVIENDPPTVDPITPVTIECHDGQHLVKLSTTVDDPQDGPLTVTWKVNGDVVETQSVDAADEVEYEGDYEHGESVVEVVVSDGILETTATTTVTVEDTEDPTVTVTPQVNLPTDPGEAFATTSRLTPPTVEDSSGHPVTLESDAPETLPLGEHVVVWTATDIGGNEVTAEQAVTVVDREKPKIGALPAIRIFCDPGKTYATPKLKKPKATDNVPGPISVAAVVPSRFKIGTTKIVWTAIDAAGNAARKTQQITVENRKPTANAGPDIVVTTKSEKGEKVGLDGSASSDPDKHVLKFAWSARGVSLAPPSSSRPLGVFPVGTTTVTLTVTDAGGAKATDTVRVTVKLKNAKKRSFGEAANASFAQAAGAVRSVAAQNDPNGSLLRGLTYAEAAAGLGDATGDFLRWEEGQSEADALLAYSELRALQQAYGSVAVAQLLSAYAETGDESLLSACSYAAYGTFAADADLREP